jgi:broad specificity phosphatase PhoE
VDTLRPFAERSGLEVLLQDGLEEWKITPRRQPDIYAVWTKCWEDSGFALPGCESSSTAQARFVRTVRTIAGECRGLTVGISTHGGVMGLLLNHLDRTCLRDCAERIRNPEVLRIRADGECMAWDRSFALAGLDEIATEHRVTPAKVEPDVQDQPG